MRETRNGFTLVELLVVMGILALLVIVFVTQVPGLMSWYRVSLSKSIMGQLEVACEEYKRVYGAYPPHNVIYHGNADTLEEVLHWQEFGYYAFHLMLQGPDGTGWGPTDDYPDVKEFGPTPESPTYVDMDYHSNGWGAPVPGTGYVSRAYFEDPFGKYICYYRAKLNSTYPHVGPRCSGDGKMYHHQWRYSYYMNQKAWHQKGVNETNSNKLFNWHNSEIHEHFRHKLRMSEDAAGHYMPHNPKSFVIWMAGADSKFGFWEWRDDLGGYIPDRDVSDKTDGVVGLCDDLLNVPD